ncbi:5-formyltetrahydrofolate cyclo-ligase [Fasciola gigantica]|uniref:5-formyltetrahydrofolate cyclo-ligase n=1 Tax=Fasciola gigantica TaxID=46835 RepID=A0A504YP69_FASGI|nr:5-formyltetrahydrofolate cyclo-ligase [Fasciola gigantica]
MIPQAKSALRQRMRTVLRSIPASVILEKSEQIINQVLDTKEFQNSNSLCAYLNMPSEPVTEQLVRQALSLNKKLYIPQVIPKSHSTSSLTTMRMCRLRSVEELDQWTSNVWGIKEPPLDAQRLTDEAIEDGGVDLIIVPGLAFTSNGHRLGRGGGYYDRYINWYRRVATERNIKFPVLFAMAFREQLVSEIPTEQHDNTMDRLFSD